MVGRIEINEKEVHQLDVGQKISSFDITDTIEIFKVQFWKSRI